MCAFVYIHKFGVDVHTSSNTCVLFAVDSDALHSRIDEVSSFVSLENYLEEVARVKPVVAITEVLSQLQKSEGDVSCRLICKMQCMTDYYLPLHISSNLGMKQ